MTFPISGTLDNIDVDTSQLEDVAIGNAVESILPWNWGTSKTKTSRQEFVVIFPPGSIQIEAVSADRLLGVAEFLRRDPDKLVYLCAVSTSSDLEMLRQKWGSKSVEGSAPNNRELGALQELAENRRRSTEKHLMKAHGIDTARLGFCRSRFDDEKKFLPSAVFFVDNK